MIEGTVYTLLSPLVADGHCLPSRFEQSRTLPLWPAIRYTIVSNDADETVCGTDNADTDDVRVQIDVVAKTHGAMLTLRDQVITALMSNIPPPARQPGGFQTYDEETKVHRTVLDYVFQQSSV
jgi:hypothetical protein